MYTISLEDTTTATGWNEIAQVSGFEAAYEAYKKACEFAELVGKNCVLFDVECAEVLAILNEEED